LAQDRLGVGGVDVAEDVGVAADEFFAGVARGILESEGTAFGGEVGVENDLEEEITEFLASPSSVWLLKLTYLDDNGWPMVTPLWYHWDGTSFYVVGRKRSKWVEYLKNDSRCAICIEEMAHPRIRKVIAQCRAEVVEGPARGEGSKWVPIAESMALRYSGPTGPEQLKASYGWERYLVKLTPINKVTTWQGADWSLRYFDPGQRPDLEKKAKESSKG
jgi:hypothetical protein